MRSTIAWTGALLIELAILLIPAHGILAARKPAHQRLKVRPCRIGQCLDVVHGVCTGQACGLGLPQCGAHEMCDRQERRCSCASAGVDVAAPTPIAKQCDADACGGPCAILLPCALEVACPAMLGECAADATGACDCRPIPTPTAGPPTPTPTPQCSGAQCSGSCFISGPPFPCPPGAVCNSTQGPEVPVQLGQCEPLTASGGCACVPMSTPTPELTPPPQCSAGVCSGSCIIAVPCSSNEPCSESAALRGECQVSPAGTCDCVPVKVTTPTPVPTIPSGCDSAACEGLCVIHPCPPDALCPDLLGHCDLNADGTCACVPGGSATPTPPPAECASLPCTGKCDIRPPCMPGGACPDYVILGTCQVVADTCTCVSSNGTPPAPPPTLGGCALSCDGRPCLGACADGTVSMGKCANLIVDQGCGCVADCPAMTPTPTPTPCVQCLPRGRTCCECPGDAALSCIDFSWVEVEPACPNGCKTFPDAQCEASCGPGPQAGPAICVPLTPAPCVVDEDCDDGNPCTIDRCTPDGCVHECLCF